MDIGTALWRSMKAQVEQEHRLDNETSDRLTDTLLVNCGRALAQAVDEQQLFQSVCNILVKDRGFRMAWFGYTEPDQRTHYRAAAGMVRSLCTSSDDTPLA